MMLQDLLGWLNPVLILVVGLVVRALVFIALIVTISVPILVALLGWQGAVHLFDRATGLRRFKHLSWREGCYYAPGHLWLRPQRDDCVRIGVDDVAQRVLPGIEAVTLRQTGTYVAKGEPIGEIRCADGEVVLRAPTAGVIAAVNARLLKSPALLHRDPYRRAWLLELLPVEDSYLDLPGDRGAERWLAAEDSRLTTFLERELGLAAADGGELMMPPHRTLTSAQWNAIRAEFLDAPSARA